MQPKKPGEIPAETVRVARAAFRKGSLAIRIRDELGSLFTDEQFADVFQAQGKPAWSPGRLVLALRFVEGPTDRRPQKRCGRESTSRTLSGWNSAIRASTSGCSRSSGTVGAGRMLDSGCWTASLRRTGRRTCWTRDGRPRPIPLMCCETRTPTDRRVESPTPDPCRCRRNHLPRRWTLRPAKIPLPEPDQDQPPAPAHRRGYQPYPQRRPPHRHTSGPHPHQPLRPAG